MSVFIVTNRTDLPQTNFSLAKNVAKLLPFFELERKSI